MLKAAEIEIKKEHQVLMVNKTTSFKKQGKSKGKFKKGGKKAATPPMKPKNGPKPDADCYYCKEKGHWKRNCSKYLADLKSGLVKKKKEVPAWRAEFGRHRKYRLREPELPLFATNLSENVGRKFRLTGTSAIFSGTSGRRRKTEHRVKLKAFCGKQQGGTSGCWHRNFRQNKETFMASE
ncbi:hypothetical protein QYE76_009581 [Lolium multiflorum]|uniref:CCHC-type domain-containing protein n=1 Tax=Lolium multiflorum TaxID=4521 RepID=A0AAD8X3P9_LOLMU|nr:hypothetical protein QYE76_009581 [Lolium multiflorum]